jgi:hypothetical protein
MTTTATSCDFFHSIDLTQRNQAKEIMELMNRLTYMWPTQILCEWLALLDIKPTRNNSDNMTRAVLIEVLCARHPDDTNTPDDADKRFLQTTDKNRTEHHDNANIVAELLTAHNYSHNPKLSGWIHNEPSRRNTGLISNRVTPCRSPCWTKEKKQNPRKKE